MTGGRERREGRGKETEGKWLETRDMGMWDLQETFSGAKGRRGRDLSPVALIRIQSISISSSLSSPSHHTLPLSRFIFLLKCSNFHGLWGNREGREREKERRWLRRQAYDGDLRGNNAIEAYIFIYPHVDLCAKNSPLLSINL